MSTTDKIVLVKLIENERFQSQGGSGQPTEYREFQLGRVATDGPRLLGVRVYAVVKGLSGNAQLKIVHYWSNDGGSWSAATDLCPWITANGQSIQTEYTDTTTFGLRLKVSAAFGASAGTGADSLIASVWLALRYQS